MVKERLSFEPIFKYVTDELDRPDKNRCEGGQFPFRKRMDHILRVYKWCKVLMSEREDINQDAVLCAAIFHDVGYARTKFDPGSDGEYDHARHGAEIAKEYLEARGFDPEFTALVTYLVENHSNKFLLKGRGKLHGPWVNDLVKPKAKYNVESNAKIIISAAIEIIPELEILQEADLLDETGALSIVWDCMMEGAMPQQSFEASLLHIEKYSLKYIQANPMRSSIGRSLWEQKKVLVEEFVTQLKADLFMESALGVRINK